MVAFDLPDLTRALLILSGKNFSNVLASTPRSAIDVTDSTGRTTLIWAASHGDEDVVEGLLACGADPNHKDTGGSTPLHQSVYASTLERLRLLFDAKTDVDMRNNDGDTALTMAAQVEDRIDLLELLSAHGADIECTNSFDRTPLRLSATENHPKQVSLLLGKGANINTSESNGRTALHSAIMYRSSAVVKILMDNPALDYDLRLDDGSTAIHRAALYADVETLNVMQGAKLSNINLDAVDADGDTALSIARRRRDENEDWANTYLEPRDEHLEAWYEAFTELMKSIRMLQGKDALVDSESKVFDRPK